MCYHVKNTAVGGWRYEAVALANVRSTVNLLARILIAKVEDERHHDRGNRVSCSEPPQQLAITVPSAGASDLSS